MGRTAARDGESTAAVLQYGDTRVTIDADEETAVEILDAVGVDARRRAVSLRVLAAPGSKRSMCVVLLVILCLLGAPFGSILPYGLLLMLSGGLAAGLSVLTAGLILFALWLLGAWVVSRPLRSTRITIGTDGIVLTRWRSRFVPYEAISSVCPQDGGVRIALQHQESIVVPTNHPATAQAVVQRIEQAMRARAGVATRNRVRDRLARDGRSVEEWRAALGELLSADAGFREAPTGCGAGGTGGGSQRAAAPSGRRGHGSQCDRRCRDAAALADRCRG